MASLMQPQGQGIARSVLSVAVTTILIAALVALALAMTQQRANAGLIRGMSDPCDSIACVSPRQLITTNDAIRMKRRLGGHVLLVDISSEASRPLDMASDVRAPFVQGVSPSGLEFRIDFGDHVDDALRSAHMRHDEPVILMCAAPEMSVLAALLLQERGYSRILVTRD